ncbi:uncharacterized protein LTR77_003565 [Saxophila tyrrhenica]|uniref:Splicing factor U2AF subunit n=1 Tax=Saxophila tyrrhenica TaxID=1690608 RepID=A0AAV9PGL0_9PEZI|nr:hypothetical protein LTR77_003565 [Saxophila tyrrhenica]
MSDRRLQSSRDDRRRDRDGDRGGRERNRSRSPRRDAPTMAPPRNRGDHGELDSYSHSRGHREREREERYGGYGGRDSRRDNRDWDRDRDRGSARRDARRDDDGRRRDNRRDRDAYDDRRRPRDDRERRDVDRDRARDRDDMQQMERQSVKKEGGSPPRKVKEPTPDLTDVVPILQKKRRMTQWDIKPPGYENVTAEQAKLSGMFPLPGAPRQQPMDPTKLKAFMDQPGGSANGAALKPSTARQSKRLFVYKLPASATDDKVAEFFNLQLNGTNVTRGVDPCISAQVSKDGSYALLEFKTPEDATNALALDGTVMDAGAMDTSTGQSGHDSGLSIKRPKDYIVPAVTDETENPAGVLSSTVPDTQYKVSVTNIPVYLSEEQVQELLVSFGELKNFVLVQDTSSGQSRGIAFCEYTNAKEATDIAVESLDGMELGDSILKVQRASIGIQQMSGELSVNAMSMMAGTTNKDADSGRVLCLMNMITPEELMDADEADEILEDVKEECVKYGPILEVKMPRPTTGNRQNNGIGKIYIKYEDSSSAKKALAALAGRKFADRTVVVTVFGEEYFDVNAW